VSIPLPRRRFLQGLACTTLAAPWVGHAQTATAFPSRPVRITTAFPPGSGPDAALRLVGEQLSRRWSQPVVVDNKPGGAGFIAVAQFKQASRDGHELVHLDSQHTTSHPHTYAKLPYDVQRDFMPIGMLQRSRFFVSVPANSPYKTLDELVAAAKAQPGKLFYGSWFNGSPGHLGALRLQASTGTEMTHVAFRDFGALYGAVANGEVQWALGSIASAGALERAGKLRFIAFAGPQREPQYPNVPSTAESASAKGLDVSAWTGLFGPADMPTTARDRIARDLAEALATPEVQERYRTIGFEAPKLDPAAFNRLIVDETRSWSDVIRRANLKLD
jgi:tripartite-type tricarboxylate transporter receptor subunit TctC